MHNKKHKEGNMEKNLIENKYGIIFRLYEPKITIDTITSISASYTAYMDRTTRDKLKEVTPCMGGQKPLIYLSCFGTNLYYQHRGYGRKMLQWVKEYFADCVLWLHVCSAGEMTDDELIGFYESEGFNKLDDGYDFQTMYIEL